MSKYAYGSKEWKLYSGKRRAEGADANYTFRNMEDELQDKSGFSKNLNYSAGGTSGFSKNITTPTETDNTMPLVIASVLAYLIFA